MGILQDRDLLDVLCELNRRFNTYGGKIDNTNVLERYEYLISHSDYGKDCGYARKYREMFIDKDYEAVKALIMEAFSMIKEIDSEYDSIQTKEAEEANQRLLDHGKEEG